MSPIELQARLKERKLKERQSKLSYRGISYSKKSSDAVIKHAKDLSDIETSLTYRRINYRPEITVTKA